MDSGIIIDSKVGNGNKDPRNRHSECKKEVQKSIEKGRYSITVFESIK